MKYLVHKFWLMVFLLSVCLLSSSLLHASDKDVTVEHVLNMYRQHYEESIRNINDYTIITEDYTGYFLKTYVDGRPNFKSRLVIDDNSNSVFTGISNNNELFTPEMYDLLKKTASYEGLQTHNGYRNHVISAHELEGFLPDFEESDIIIRFGRFYIDSEKWVIRKMEFIFEAEEEDEEVQVLKPEIYLEDYRDIEGMMIPFKTVMIMEGVSDNLSPEDKAEILKNLEELERQMQEMSPEEAEMMESMLGGHLASYRKMLETNRMEFSYQLIDVKVNTALTEDFFEE